MRKINLYASGIISPFHLKGVLSFALSRIELGESINGIVFLDKGPWDNYLLEEQTIEHLNLTLNVTKSPISTNTPKILVSLKYFITRPRQGNNFIYVCGHGKANIKLLTWMKEKNILSDKTVFKTVVFDEGIGSYGDLIYYLKANIRESKFVLKAVLAIFFGYPIVRKLLNSKYFVDINWKLFIKKSNGEFKKNRAAINGYRKAFCLNNPDLLHKLPAVLFVSQPLYSLGIIKEDAYFSFLQEISDYYRKSGIELIIKPHPAEDFEKYRNSGITISDYKGTAEELIYKMNVISVIGFGSTTLITASAIFGIPTYSLINLLDNHKSLLDLIEQCQSIKELFKANVHFVNNFSDLLPSDLRK